MKLPIRKKALIQTERLTLKPYEVKDVEALADLLMNQEIGKTFMVPDFQTRDQAIALAEKLVAFSCIEDTTHLEYGIYLGDQFIGFVNDCDIEGTEIEIGYVVHPDYQGHGYATEAVNAVIEDLREMGFQKVVAGFFEENKPSCRVMERCGMRPNGVVDEEEYRGIRHKCLYYELVL